MIFLSQQLHWTRSIQKNYQKEHKNRRRSRKTIFSVKAVEKIDLSDKKWFYNNTLSKKKQAYIFLFDSLSRKSILWIVFGIYFDTWKY